MTKTLITFDENVKLEVLDFLNKSVDKEGFVVEKDDPTQKVLAPDGTEMKLEDFAGVRKGSEIYIKKDLDCLIEVSDMVQ